MRRPSYPVGGRRCGLTALFTRWSIDIEVTLLYLVQEMWDGSVPPPARPVWHRAWSSSDSVQPFASAPMADFNDTVKGAIAS